MAAINTPDEMLLMDRLYYQIYGNAPVRMWRHTADDHVHPPVRSPRSRMAGALARETGLGFDRAMEYVDEYLEYRARTVQFE